MERVVRTNSTKYGYFKRMEKKLLSGYKNSTKCKTCCVVSVIKANRVTLHNFAFLVSSNK